MKLTIHLTLQDMIEDDFLCIDQQTENKIIIGEALD